MNEFLDSADLDRLRAADPTSPGDPDLQALRERVLAATADAPAAAQEPATSGRVVRIGWAVAASVALLAAGTVGGVALGRATNTDPIPVIADGPDEIPAINSSGDVAGAPSAGIPGGPGPQAPVLAGGATLAEDAATSMIWPGYAEGFEPAPDLADDTGIADGYRLTSAGIDRSALATVLAGAFDVPGAPQASESVIVVGSPEGSGPTVWVYDDASVSWSFADPSRDPWACAEPRVEPAPGPADSSMPEEVPPIGGPCEQVGQSMPEDEALGEAERILSQIGVIDTPNVDIGIDWETFDDGAVTTVTAWQTIDGERTQLSWSISFDSQGPLWANGFAAGLELVPDLPVVGARTAVVRSAEPRWSAFGPTPVDPIAVPLDTPMVIADDEPTLESTDSPTTSDITIAWDPAIVTGADEGLAQYWDPSGQFWLLPGYRLSTADDRGTWMIIAVADSVVTFAARP